MWQFKVQAIREGVLPLWNPYNSLGTPFLGNIQTCVFYPLSFLLYIPDYRLGFNMMLLLHLALAALSTFLWMRECGASRPASFLAGLAFSLGGYATSVVSLTITLAALAYFPLALLTLRRALRSPGFFWKGLAAVVLVLQYLAGDPTIFFSTLIVFVFTIAFKSLEASLQAKRLIFSFAAGLVLIFAVFLALAAPQLLLFVEFIFRSDRLGLDYDQITMWSLQLNDIASFFFPFFSDISIAFMDYWVRQSWLDNGYVGITVLLLALAGLKSVRKNPIQGYHILLALFGLALALGRFSLVHGALFHVFPFFSFIRYPARFLFIFQFALACLAGFGADALLRALNRSEKSMLTPAQAKAAGFVIATGVLAILGTMFFASELRLACIQKACQWLHGEKGASLTTVEMHDIVHSVTAALVNAKRTFVLAFLFLIGWLAALHFKPRKTVLVVFFTLLVFSDLVGANTGEIRLDAGLLNRPGKVLSRILEDQGVYRVMVSPKAAQFQHTPQAVWDADSMQSRLMEVLTPNFLLPFRVSDIVGYDSIYLRGLNDLYKALERAKEPNNNRLIDMLNVKYLVSTREELGPPYKLLLKSDPVNLFLNERFQPRAFLVPRAEVRTKQSILSAISSEDYRPEETVYLEEDPGPYDEKAAVGPGADKVDILDYTPNGSRLKVDSSREQWLFLSDTFYPGWTARIHGKTLRVFRANYLFRAVRVPAGSFVLEWKYEPILFKIGLTMSLLTGLALAVYYTRKIRIQKAGAG